MTIGYQALRESCAWIDLSHRAKIRVSGEDAGRLLHAMSTNSVVDLKSGEGRYAFFLTDKGRIMGDATIFHLVGDYWLDCEPSGGPVIHHHLDKFIIADDAEVHDETTLWSATGIEGPQSVDAMERLNLPVPTEPLAIVETDWGFVARMSFTGHTGFRIWHKDSKRLSPLIASADIPQANEHECKVVRMENGIPTFGEDISERYLVQETQQLRAVSFNKGCYLGQEIVERVRSQGKVHRLLSPIRVSGSTLPVAGSKLVLGEAPAGEITSAAFSPAFNEVVAFAYVRSEMVASRPDMQVTGMSSGTIARLAGAN